jgi:heptosyltransferase-2
LKPCGSVILQEALDQGACPEVWIRFPRNLGDVLFALPFFGSLQRAWNPTAEQAGHRLRWIAVGHSIGASLFSEAAPDLVAENLVESGGQGKPDPWSLYRRWRQAPPVAVINLSQSVRLALGAWLARVPIRAGDVNNHLSLLYHYRFTYRDLPNAIVERFRPLLLQLTGGDDLRWLPISPQRFGGHRGPEKLRAAGWNGEPYVTLGFGTRGFSKRWFPEQENWPALARLLQERGYRAVWLGGPDERAQGAELAAAVPGSCNLVGQTSIPEACAIQYGAHGNVAVDTGLVHTAAATGRPTVMINGLSPEPLIFPVGPRFIGLRGPAVDIDGQARAAFETHGSSAHRIAPGRVLGVLEALMAEAPRRGDGRVPWGSATP